MNPSRLVSASYLNLAQALAVIAGVLQKLVPPPPVRCFNI
jgi:hypothetical protein